MPKYNELPHSLREALENRKVTPEQAEQMAPYDLLHEYLMWNGIIGYTSEIWRVLDKAGALKGNVNSGGDHG